MKLKSLKNLRNFRTAAVFVLFLLVSPSCSTLLSRSPKESQSRPGEPTASPSAFPDESFKSQARQLSSVDIQYTLGRDHYRFLARAKNNRVWVTRLRENEVVDSGEIPLEKYPEYIHQAFTFVQDVRKKTQVESGQRKPASQSACRSPFTVTVKMGKEVSTTQGCRSTAGGDLSKLINDGEFLFFSKNE